ncbi:uncharacterized protein JCM15063_001218 [Sporobolomyces koalae]|uniref:uncharacterized protein n=1 Tax=Sporobolomyces koalae TaxID=500713 RepID=UPI00316E6469
MLDRRDYDRLKYAVLTPQAFQQAQTPTSATRPARHSRTQKRHQAQDFYYESVPTAQIDAWFLRFPVLGKRNFYIVQNHCKPSLVSLDDVSFFSANSRAWYIDATAKHFDLRLQLDGGLFSFAIPRGFSQDSLHSSKTQPLARLAIETSIHPINYALFEGVGSTGTTAVWDVGEYRVHPTKKKARLREQLHEQGLDGEATTDSDSELEDSRDRQEVQDEAVTQEDLLRKALARSSFGSGTIQTSSPDAKGDAKRDVGQTRGFVLELVRVTS